MLYHNSAIKDYIRLTF